jgi:hypothetical protein
MTTVRLFFLGSLTCAAVFGQRHELGLTLGRFTGVTRVTGGSDLDLGSGTALQANYGYRIAGSRLAALYGEVHVLASPQRLVGSRDTVLTRDVASLYLTPGVRLRFFPHSRVAPYVAAGGGLAWYEQSRNSLNGAPNGAPREAYRGAFDFGGGVDVPLWRFAGLRAELRDFYTGSPAYDTASIAGGQHNIVAGGGFVFRFGRTD